MPSPTPLPLSGFTTVLSPLGCIKKDDPATSGQLDEPRWETIGGSQTDSKLLWGPFLTPYRFMIFASTPGVTAQDVWNELNAHPNTYWPQVAWGSTGEMGWTGSAWTVIPPGVAVVSPYLASYSMFTCSDSGGIPLPGNINQDWAVAFQLLCPQLFTAKSYELWHVTARASAGLQTGTFPSPNPWSSSSDFAFVSSGSLNPGATLVVPPAEFMTLNGSGYPITSCQEPPAPTNNIDSDWSGWGFWKYLVWV